MGHYASEMTGPGRTEEENLKVIEECRQGLAAHWENGLKLASTYPFSNGLYVCPQCYSSVQFIFLSFHDQWHSKLKSHMILGSGLL